MTSEVRLKKKNFLPQPALSRRKSLLKIRPADVEQRTPSL
jgi:hypothetical protein